MHLELGEENNKLILTHTDFTIKISKSISVITKEGPGLTQRLLNFMTKEAIGK